MLRRATRPGDAGFSGMRRLSVPRPADRRKTAPAKLSGPAEADRQVICTWVKSADAPKVVTAIVPFWRCRLLFASLIGRPSS